MKVTGKVGDCDPGKVVGRELNRAGVEAAYTAYAREVAQCIPLAGQVAPPVGTLWEQPGTFLAVLD